MSTETCPSCGQPAQTVGGIMRHDNPYHRKACVQAAYVPEIGHLVRVQRWEVPCPEIPGTWERRLLIEMDGTVESVRELAGGYLVKLAGDDADPIFTGYQFSGMEGNTGPSWSLVTEVTHRAASEPPDLDALSETRKRDRAVMARYVADLARAHDLEAEVTPGPCRRTSVNLSGPHGLRLTVRFRGDTPQCEPDTYVLNWHGVHDGYRLSPAVFQMVNTCHGQKATDVVQGYRELCELLSNRFAYILTGPAFQLAS